MLGGWSIVGITTFQTRTPYTMVNGSDGNLDGIDQMDRPDNSRAFIHSPGGDSARHRAAALPHRLPQSGYGQVPQRRVRDTPAGFPNRDFTNSGIRSMWVHVKLLS